MGAGPFSSDSETTNKTDSSQTTATGSEGSVALIAKGKGVNVAPGASYVKVLKGGSYQVVTTATGAEGNSALMEALVAGQANLTAGANASGLPDYEAPAPTLEDRLPMIAGAGLAVLGLVVFLFMRKG